MSKRRTCHDKSVRRRASGLRSNGWGVHADVSGFPRPRIFNGSRPDIYAKKGKKVLLYEVETKASKARDKEQHRNLRKYAKSRKNVRFKMGVC